MTAARPIRRALISVSDKDRIVDFARRLADLGVEIISTGGTASLLKDSGIRVTEVSHYTDSPEIMGGRVKTLHPRIHGGLLGRRHIDDEVMARNGIEEIDLLAVNLYPFEQTVANPDCTLSSAIENIDIGGPAMIRAAAKNHARVTVVVDNEDYHTVLEEMESHDGEVCDETRYRLAVKAFAHTARYDGVIANYLGSVTEKAAKTARFPPFYTMQFTKTQDLRYGENPHQRAAFYTETSPPAASISTARQLQGKALSFNNIADTDSALECVKCFNQGPACVIVKHANPCGTALGGTLLEAYENAYRTDPTSAFGGIIAFNRTLDAPTARRIIEQQFVEVLIAPAIADDALSALSSKPNVRVLACGPLNHERSSTLDYKRVTGGLLIQDRDTGSVSAMDLKTVTRRTPTEEEINDLLFAWTVARFVKSNAIVYCKGGVTVGIGAGQMSRVDSARIAAIKAADIGRTLDGSVMASDAFFPFRDALDSAAAAGITAVIQPGGSIRDREVIDAADEHGITMVFTGMRHFRH